MAPKSGEAQSSMTREEFLARQLGDDPPLLADGRRPPDRREISFRWLSGTFMTAITSSLLMGVALFGAVEGREQLTLPAEALASSEELARAVTEALGGASATALRVGRFSVRRAKDGRQLAVAAELGRGRSGATRWTAYPR